MPAPFGGDPWLSKRHFGIVIDAGSSGSRLQIYSWRSPKAVIAEAANSDAALKGLPHVEKGAREGEQWSIKTEPGISSFANNPQGIAAYLRPLLHHAREQVPPSRHKDTPLFLLATAGMRLLDPPKQAEILKEACSFLTLHSEFKIEGPSDEGPCGKSIQIITGEEEGLFGWIAVNYLMDGFVAELAEKPTTYGFLDMGGASTQIAFEPLPEHGNGSPNLIDVRLRLLSGQEIVHKVFVTTWLGYGTNKARERYVAKAINDFEQQQHQGTGHDHGLDDTVYDPCLPRDLVLTEKPYQTVAVNEHNKKSHTLHGTGSFEKCMKQTAPLLNKGAPCPDVPCPMNGIHVPTIDFSVSHFIGISEYWYSSEHVFGLGGPYDFVQYERAAAAFCSREWKDIVDQHEKNKVAHHLGGDGQVEKDGQVVEVGKWDSSVEIPRLQMQCFKAAWITNVLHDGLGLPRIVDPGGNSTTHGDEVAEHAKEKGLGRPTFQSVDSVRDIAISWTLGKMVLEASKEVPLKSLSDKPLVDPIDNIPSSSDSPIRKIRPFLNIEALEDKITPHLPSSLHRSSLGFSPVLFLFWIVMFIVASFILWPLRRRLRYVFLRFFRTQPKRDGELFKLEEGSFMTSSTPSSPVPWLSSISRTASRSSKFNRTPSSGSPVVGNGTPSANRIPPISRSVSGASSVPPSFTSSRATSRSSSPLPSPNFGGSFNFGNEGDSLGSIASSRSRNTSQVNLKRL